MTDSTLPPPVDLSILQQQLDQLFKIGCKAARAHREEAYRLGVPTNHWGWANPIFHETDWPRLEVDDTDVIWSDTDTDGDIVAMAVPIAVLNGTMSVEQWAQRTYDDYTAALRKAEEERANREAQERDKRKALYDKLKKEFGDNP